MSLTLWPDLRREVALQNAREIFAERLWLPVYEEGGLDALEREGLVHLPPPLPTPEQLPMSDYL